MSLALLDGAMEARRRSQLDDANHAAQAYWLGWLHAVCAMLGCNEDEAVAMMELRQERAQQPWRSPPEPA